MAEGDIWQPAADPKAANVCPVCGFALRAKYAEYKIRKNLLRRIATGRICNYPKQHVCPECSHKWSTPCLATPKTIGGHCRGHDKHGNMHPKLRGFTGPGNNAPVASVYHSILREYMGKVPAGLLDRLLQDTPQDLTEQIRLAHHRQVMVLRRYQQGSITQAQYEEALSKLAKEIASLMEADRRIRKANVELQKLEQSSFADLWSPVPGTGNETESLPFTDKGQHTTEGEES